MYYTRHERNMQDAFCNFLHMASYRCGIHAASRHLVYMDRSFGGRRRRSYLLHLQDKKLAMPKDDRSKLVVRGDLSEIRTHDTSEHPALQDPVRRGVRLYHCSLVGLSGFEPETSSM